METALQILGEAGIPGAMIIGLAYAVFYLHTQLQRNTEKYNAELMRIADARVEDGKKVAADALAREDKWVGVIGDLTDAIKESTNRRN